MPEESVREADFSGGLRAKTGRFADPKQKTLETPIGHLASILAGLTSARHECGGLFFLWQGPQDQTSNVQWSRLGDLSGLDAYEGLQASRRHLDLHAARTS